MSFRSLTHYFIHQAMARAEEDEPQADAPTGWEKNMERSSDLVHLHRLGDAIVALEPDSIELKSEAGQERLQEITHLLEQARKACWQL